MKWVVAALVASVALIVPSIAAGTHPRPKGASPIRASLVPSYQPCAAPDRTHGPPLAFPSCSTPDPASSYLTVGTPDANGSAARSVSSFFWKAVPGTPGPPTDNGIGFSVDITDVRCRIEGPACAGPGADYAGSVEVRLPSQFTDHYNDAPGGGYDPATTVPFNFGFTVSCAMTADPAIGSKCSRVIPYIEQLGIAIPDTQRTLWEVGQVQIWDGGADADASTAGDNTLFGVQGIFIP